MREYDARWRRLAEDKAVDLRRHERQERAAADVQTLAHVMNWGLKCKKDGMLEWERGNWPEAHASWYQADDALRRFKALDGGAADRKLLGLHGVILNNLAQACIKLGYWRDALVATDAAIEINPDDHKAWFRRAVACEGLGRLGDARL